jgi:4-aminobutyrate aminotransferase-like enzyme
LAAEIVELMKERGVLLSTDGPFHNVIKIKPPIVFSEKDADFLLSNLNVVLEERGKRK